MDQKELVILRELRKNARVNATEINRKHEIPVSTVFDKIAKMEKNKGYIIKHTSLIDFQKMNKIRILAYIEADDWMGLMNFLAANPNINNLSRLKDAYDFSLEAVFDSHLDCEKFLQKLEQFRIQNIKVHYVLDDLKREEFLP